MLISPYPDQEGNKLTFLSEWREFPSAPCLARKKKNLMTARVSMVFKSRAPLTCFQACFLPGRAKDLSVPRYQEDPQWSSRSGLRDSIYVCTTTSHRPAMIRSQRQSNITQHNSEADNALFPQIYKAQYKPHS